MKSGSVSIDARKSFFKTTEAFFRGVVGEENVTI